MNPTTSGVSPAGDFFISRVFPAPRALVFDAWIDPKRLVRWWGPRDFTNPVCEIDARPGGAYRIVMRSPKGVDYPMCGVFREVIVPQKLVLTMDCSGHPDDWHDLVNPQRDRSKGKPHLELLQTATFDDLGGKTQLTVTTRFETAAIRDAMLNMGMTEGWTESLERLADCVARSE